MSERCPWKIHWGTGQESTTQCDKPAHILSRQVDTLPSGRLLVRVDGDQAHDGPSGVQAGQRVTWLAGDRREYTGDWPGLCPDQPCVLHRGHNGRCAP